MTDPAQTQVALLIDFENLVYGLQEAEGDAYASHVEPELLVRLAEEYGQVVVASAYADWRGREVNQFQTDLYRLGIDLVHVLGKRQQARMKNAVDVKMAVDAIETVWTLPHITTFVIVSGDRDFIHVLKALRRHGRTVIGVSPDGAVSEDFAALCDRFVRYSALSGALQPETGEARAEAPGAPGLEAVRDVLRALMKERPSGLKGAQIKPLLRSRLSVTFDESEYGYSRLTDMLLAMPDAVRVVTDRRGGDVLVMPPESEAEGSASSAKPVLAESRTVSPGEALVRAAKLRDFAFDANQDSRRAILRAMYRGMKRQEPFALFDVFGRVVQEADSSAMTVSRLSKYQYVLWQSRAFVIEDGQQDKPTRERLMRLDPAIGSEDELIARYESSIAYKLLAAARASGESLAPQLLSAIFGLPADEASVAYCAGLIGRHAGLARPGATREAQ